MGELACLKASFYVFPCVITWEICFYIVSDVLFTLDEMTAVSN